MKPKNESPESNNGNKWSFIKKSQEIIERKNHEQAPEDLVNSAPLNQFDNLSELESEIKESVTSTRARP